MKSSKLIQRKSLSVLSLHCFHFKYHQIWTYHHHECEVNYNDHDFPLGYKLILCGYMILSDDKDIFNVNSVNGGERVKWYSIII